MNFQLKTSKDTGEKLISLQGTTGLSRNIISRLAVSLSLRDPSLPKLVANKSGIDIPRSVMTGENDYLYKALIRQHAKKNITDEEYFPNLFNAHLERGIVLLENEYKHAGNYEKLLQNLLKMEI
jgi:DNA sulfur modification protein DndE